MQVVVKGNASRKYPLRQHNPFDDLIPSGQWLETLPWYIIDELDAAQNLGGIICLKNRFFTFCRIPLHCEPFTPPLDN